MLALLVVGVLALLAAGYFLYGGWVARLFRLDPSAATPAHRHEDGVDFVPTRPFYLMGQHFSAIAAAGPIAGPIIACTQFGWLPCILWIGLGVVLVGAVHDFSTLVASVRHDGRTIAEIVRGQLGPRAWVSFTAFVWLALVYVIVAFTDVTAATFVAGDPETAGLETSFDPGGAVAMASVLYLGLAVAMGLVERFLKPPLWLQTIVFVPATLGAVWAGTQLSTVLVLPAMTWIFVILGYCFVASLLPVWSLLQPRGYLGGFVLYLALAAGVLGVLFGGFDVHQPAFKGFRVPGETGLLFPFLFVTIACGACSGFHGLVCSGTTSKQISRETHCRPVGYGAMLLEAFVAVLALATILIATGEETAGKGPGTIYGDGLGRFLAVVIGEEHYRFAATFGAMAFSTFIFDTLDVSTRLGRLLLQELFSMRSLPAALAATALTCGVPLLFLLASQAGSYRDFWILFGSSNQLLAALSLLGITVWLKRTGRPFLFTLIPCIFLLAVTMSALGLQAWSSFSSLGEWKFLLNGSVAVVLLLLALGLLGSSARALTSAPSPR